MTDCFHQLIKLRIQPTQVSAIPLMDFLPISLRERRADRTRQLYRAVTLHAVILPSSSVSFSRHISDSYQNSQAPSSCIFICQRLEDGHVLKRSFNGLVHQTSPSQFPEVQDDVFECLFLSKREVHRHIKQRKAPNPLQRGNY